MSEEATLNEFINTSDNESSKSEERQSRFWGEIPSDWNLVDGSGIYEVNPNPDPIQQPNTYIEMDAINTELPFPDYFGERNASEYSGKTFTQGDTLFARITPCTENGKAALVPEMETEVGIGSTEFAVLSPKSDIIHPWLLYYLNKSHPVHNYAVSRMRGSTGRQRVPFNMFRKELDFPLPPLSEQRKIATVLHTVDQAIQKTVEIIEQKERIWTGLMQDVFTDVYADSTKSVRLSAVDTEIPEHWEVKTVGEVSIQITDGAHLTPDRSEEGYLLLSARNVKNGYLDLSEVDYVPEEEYERLIEKCNPQSGDILISCSGTVGRVCEVPEDLDFALVRSAALVKFDNSLASSYAEKVLQSVGAQKQIKAYQTQSAQPNLFQGQIASLEIPIPSIEEQRDIAKKLDDISGSIKSDQQYQSQLKRLKRGLMQDLLSGEVRTTDVDIDIPEEVAKYG
jgi:type I restriction enzyme S subunit